MAKEDKVKGYIDRMVVKAKANEARRREEALQADIAQRAKTAAELADILASLPDELKPFTTAMMNAWPAAVVVSIPGCHPFAVLVNAGVKTAVVNSPLTPSFQFENEDDLADVIAAAVIDEAKAK